MGLMEIVLIGFVFSLMLSVVLAFILVMIYIRHKEDEITAQIGRTPEQEISHGIL